MSGDGAHLKVEGFPVLLDGHNGEDRDRLDQEELCFIHPASDKHTNNIHFSTLSAAF